ncbi:phosphatidate cytidylyltransferase [Plasmopara halstedii]|uniref:Phosphatidate cytidylyltransferase n=1 Tax=Plasmopara halstedii TaxID=4781 RepID=A0A0P1A9P0_PLAHL|nr:phosphatidate cytidylyltransferase [Plasmopara halstedii]CEG37328.1 phosphatidate cytidylyltransferase [Plasmopara halstedii]|eukprot:XP_024573697.1 phosphatidate cytidylyltransferase [Plasmopara halstedii]
MSIVWGPRILTGLVGVPVALLLLSTDASMLLLITTAKVKMTHCVLLVASGMLLCLGAWTGDKQIYDAVSFGATLIVFTFHIVISVKTDRTALIKLLLDIFALFYIANGFSYSILLRCSSNKYGHGLQLLALCCTWVCDSGALFVGSTLGRAKLASAVSPSKTVVGAMAGVLSSVATVLIMFSFPRLLMESPMIHTLLPPLDVVPYMHQLVLGTVLGVLCIMGDLVESYIKRVAGVKDSGSFFPGHGGCLDRMDSLLLVAPYLYFHTQFALPKQ